MNTFKAKLTVVSGPSGAGLSGILEQVIHSRIDLGFVLPVTARKMRKGEVNGVGFQFYDLNEWKEHLQSGDLLEHTLFAGNDYGTSRSFVEAQLAQGKNVLLNLEVDRAAQIKEHMPEAVCIYMEPSSDEILKARYEATARNAIEVSVRMETAQRQRALSHFCDCRIFTDDPAQAASELSARMDA